MSEVSEDVVEEEKELEDDKRKDVLERCWCGWRGRGGGTY